ncbi:MAG: YihY/virulence factor BrkB family protein [Acidobacteria bacterium]|nr:YihY/virulence factor BrkB family protein [Acidobacteriota bacterium]
MTYFENFSFKGFFKDLYEKTLETDLFGRAAQVAFYFSFAFFPLLLFLVTLFGLVLDSTESLEAKLYYYFAQLMPPSAYSLVRTTMTEIIENSSGGKLTLGAVVTLWSASAGVDSLRNSLNSVYEVDESRAWWYTTLQSLVLTLLFILLLAVALGILTAGWQLAQTAVDAAGYQISSPLVLTSIQWIGLLVVTLFTTAVVYSWLPSFEEFHWVWISPGAIVAILLWLVFTGGFRLYLQFFNSYNKSYGSLGAVIILMLWMYLTGMALLIGGAINSVLTERSESSAAKEAKKNTAAHAVSEANKQQARRRGA